MAGKKYFEAKQSQDFEIKDDDGVVGRLRVKPNALAWKPKQAHMFHQVSIEKFAEFAVETGKEVKQ